MQVQIPTSSSSSHVRDVIGTVQGQGGTRADKLGI